MTFEFIISCNTTSVRDIHRALINSLVEVLENNEDEFDTYDADQVDQMIQLRHVRMGESSTEDDGAETAHVLVGFILELPEEAVAAEAIVQEFAESLTNTPPIVHAVRFEDPLLQAELAERAKEIFALEMKLRRVLSLIYLYAYRSEEPFNLLRNEKVNPMGKPTPEQMKRVGENQFFHLTFGNYAALNQKQEFKHNELLKIIRDADTYEKFYDEFNRVPIEHEDDVELLAGLNNLMDSIEGMRNCVAHNRRPDDSSVENYNNARSQLHKILDNYLYRWEMPIRFEEETPWDRTAREAVEYKMETASWDIDTKAIIFEREDGRHYDTTSSLEELKSYLREVAVSAFLGEVPYYDDPKPAYECDEYGIVESVLYDYEDRLAELFERNGTDELS